MAISLKDLQKGPRSKAPAMVFYGVSGIGKTTFAAGCPGAVFVLTEDGLGTLDVAHFPVAQSWQQIKETLTALCVEDHKYQTVVIDTLDRLEKLIFAQVAKDHEKTSVEDLGYGKGYVYALTYWEELLKALNYLRETKGMMVVLLGHSTIRTFTPPDPNLDPYDLYKLELHDKAANMLKDWCDMLLFARYKVYTKLQRGAVQKKARGLGEGERCILTEERPSHWAKNRFGMAYELPFPKENAWEVVFEAMTKPQAQAPAEEEQAPEEEAKEE